MQEPVICPATKNSAQDYYCVDEEERCSDDSDCCEGSCYGTTDGSGEFCHSECPEDPDYKCFEPPETPRPWSPERRAQLLQWTTGHARVPVQGFSHLMGRDGVLRKFTLTSLELSQAVYPRAHTCFNRIDVPLYRTKEELVAGFEFVLELGDLTFTMD